MKYEEVVKILKPLEGHYVHAYAGDNEVQIAEVWVREVRYLPPHKRSCAHWADASVILWTGGYDEGRYPSGFVIPAARINTITKIRSGVFRLVGTARWHSEEGKAAEVEIEVRLMATDAPRYIKASQADDTTAAFTYNRVAWEAYVRKLVEEGGQVIDNAPDHRWIGRWITLPSVRNDSNLRRRDRKYRKILDPVAAMA